MDLAQINCFLKLHNAPPRSAVHQVQKMDESGKQLFYCDSIIVVAVVVVVVVIVLVVVANIYAIVIPSARITQITICMVLYGLLVYGTMVL